MSEQPEDTYDDVPIPTFFERRGKKYHMEFKGRQWLALHCVTLYGEAQVLGLLAALVLCVPTWAQRVGYPRKVQSLREAAENLYDVLLSMGWTSAEIMAAGASALPLVMARMPPADAEVRKQADFFETTQPDGTPGGSFAPSEPGV